MAGIMEKGLTRYPPKTIAAARTLFASGETSFRKIADQLGVSSDVVVRRWCDERFRQRNNELAKLRARRP